MASHDLRSNPAAYSIPSGKLAGFLLSLPQSGPFPDSMGRAVRPGAVVDLQGL